MFIYYCLVTEEISNSLLIDVFLVTCEHTLIHSNYVMSVDFIYKMTSFFTVPDRKLTLIVIFIHLPKD